MAERKKATGKGKATPARKKRGRKQKAPTSEQRAEAGTAVVEDLRAGEIVPWGHLALEEADAGRKSLSVVELMQRNSEIFRAWMKGLSVETLAETYRLHPGTIRKILKEMKAVGTRATDLDPQEIIEDHVMQLNALVDEFAAHAAREKGAGRTNALARKLDAMRERFKVLQEVGILPQDLGTIGVQLDLRSIGLLLYRALEVRNLAEPTLLEELADIIEGRQDPEEVLNAEVVGEETVAA